MSSSSQNQAHFGTAVDFLGPVFVSPLNLPRLRRPTPAITLRSNIFLKHLRTNGYLHSHKDRYPLRYEDGRVSSQGQQVTGYSHKDDPNNQWTVIPVDPPFPNSPGWHPNDVKGGKRHLRDGDLVRLLHVLSDAYLVTHDVASPSMKTNMEVTLISGEAAQKRFGETVWRVEIIPERANAAGKPAPWKSTRRRVLKGGEQKIRFINVIHKVALYSHPKVLPQWGFGQFEVNGNKEVQDAGLNEWSIDTAFPIVDNPNDPMDKPMETVPVVAPGSTIKRVRIKKSALKEPDLLEARKVPKMGFLAKFFELQGLMIRHNAGLTKAHPYQSTPETWPTLVRGISFWERKGPPTWRQIYLLGNPLAWWFAICGVGLYAVIWLLDQILLRKGVDEFGYIARRYFNRGVGYAFLAWVLHYVPFYVQGRSLFLHHYLPAYVFSCLTTAGSIEFLINVVPRMPALIYGRDGVKATDDEARSQFDDERKFELVRRSAFRTGRGWWMAVWALSAVFGLTFWYFAFLAYGDPVEDIEVIRRRQWIKTWDLQVGIGGARIS